MEDNLFNNLKSNALQHGQTNRVGFDQRRIIEKILTQYSTDFVIFRELIQNADDAEATSFHLEIKCDGPSSSSVVMDFHNRKITEIRTINNGRVFTETDWKRVATIAEGNPNPQSVGQFGVGFFSVFSYAEEPIIRSGNEYMIFHWQDNNLLHTRQKLPVEQQSKLTSIILKVQNKLVIRIESTLDNSTEMNDNIPTINLTQLKAYFAKVLTFTRHILSFDIKINDSIVFHISKTKHASSSVKDTFVVKSQDLNNSMLFVNSFVLAEQTYTIANGPSITLGHLAVEVRVTVDQQFHNYIRNIFKSLPSSIQIELLFVPTDVIITQQRLHLSTTNYNLNTQILQSILPLKFLDNEIVPSGLIFIGLGTHQSSGIGMHVCSHFIPTVERVNLNLQDPYIAKWNTELLRIIGIIARCMYDQAISDSSECISPEHYNAVISPYFFQSTTPIEKVGTIVRNEFFASKNDIFVPIKQLPSDKHLSLISSKQAYLANSRHIHNFLSLPLVPFELTKNCFFTALKEHQLINIVNESVIEDKLKSSILLHTELIELLTWLCSLDIHDNAYAKRVLSVVRYRETVNSSIHNFDQMIYYDASEISLILPPPPNVLSTCVAKYFSPEQLHQKLFLSPYTLRQLIYFYLSEGQHDIFHDVTKATYFLHLLSNNWNHFSEQQWKEIKTVVSMIECIPTTRGMKLPNNAYIPSPTLRYDLPAITLNLLSDKTMANQESNETLVSVHFLKQIGCRMLDVQSIIDYYSRMSNMTTTNQESMQILIENLMKERNNMSDADFDALKKAKFLQGTTLGTIEESRQTYSSQELHFPFVAEQLEWTELPILNWHDIDQHSPEYAFLKEIGVREVPDLHELINRIVYEHYNKHFQNKQMRRKAYKIPIALEFFAKNFSKHYSTLWKASNIQQAFLPSSLHDRFCAKDIILSAPDKVFKNSNPICATLLPKVVKLFENHFNISLLGILERPTLAQAFDNVMKRKTELLTVDSARRIFAYFNELDGLNQTFIKSVSDIAFIPLQGFSRVAAPLMKPSRVFIRSDQTAASEQIDASGLIDYVDFGAEANSFLKSIGVLQLPPIPVLAQLLLERQKVYLTNTTANDNTFDHKVNVYMECLKRIANALNDTPELNQGSLKERLKNEQWCLGQIDDPKNNNFRIVKPTEIYLNDDNQCALIHRPICSPNKSLNKLYEHFGAKWLSDCVSRQLLHKGKSNETVRSKELRDLIKSRRKLLFVNDRCENLDGVNEQHVEQLQFLSVYEVDDIQCQLTFQNNTIIPDHNYHSSCVLITKKQKVMLYFRRDLSELDYADIARELVRFVFKNPPENVAYRISQNLSSSLETLKRHNVPVDQILDTQSIKQWQAPLQSKQNSKASGIFERVSGFFGGLSSKDGRSNMKNNPFDIPIYNATQRNERSRSVENVLGSSFEHNNHRIGNDREQYMKPQRMQENVIKKSSVVLGRIENFKQDEIESDRMIHRMILDSCPLTESAIIENEHIEREVCISCIQNPAVHMIRYNAVTLSIPLYVEKDVYLNEKMIGQAKQLEWVLTSLATHVFKLPIESLHMFRDVNGSRMAFNYRKALFFNLRYFEQVFADDLEHYLRTANSSNLVEHRIVNFYYVILCHELTHNIYLKHDFNFMHTLENMIVKFMMQKELFMQQFSFEKQFFISTPV